MDAGQPPADVHQRRWSFEQATGIPDTKSTRANDRPDDREADLAAVRVARQHQVETVATRPRKLIG